MQPRKEAWLCCCLIRRNSFIFKSTANSTKTEKPVTKTPSSTCSPRAHLIYLPKRPRDCSPSQPSLHPPQQHLPARKRSRDSNLETESRQFKRQPVRQPSRPTRSPATLTSGKWRRLQAKTGDSEERSTGRETPGRGESEQAVPKSASIPAPVREDERQAAQWEPCRVRPTLSRHRRGEWCIQHTGKHTHTCAHKENL